MKYFFCKALLLFCAQKSTWHRPHTMLFFTNTILKLRYQTSGLQFAEEYNLAFWLFFIYYFSNFYRRVFNRECSTIVYKCNVSAVRRLRIGHTRITHKYLLSGDSQPLYDKCQCSLTVKHILLECFSLKHVRENYFTCSSLKELFENVDATTIMDFIKEVNFYHRV